MNHEHAESFHPSCALTRPYNGGLVIELARMKATTRVRNYRYYLFLRATNDGSTTTTPRSRNDICRDVPGRRGHRLFVFVVVNLKKKL